MIEFRAFGSVELTHAEGHPIASVLAQPKRLALLAYLALGSPGGFQRRDTLLGLFWAESDMERGRGALRQAIRFLRRSLGEGVLVNRGEDEIGVVADAFRCDVVAFEAALDAGDDVAALALYRGDLFEGFFIADAPEWDRWLEAERVRLRRRAAAAAARCADAAGLRRDWPEAIARARQACALEPDDETAARRLISLLDQAGDRAGAVAEYERFAAWLAAELELEPSPETVLLIEAVRRRADAPAALLPAGPPHAAAASTPSPNPASASAPNPASASAPPVDPAAASAPSPDPATPRAPRAPQVRAGRSRGRKLVTSGALLLLLLSVAAYWAWPGGAAEPPRPQRFLVAPFENLTGEPALDPLGRMAADWISQGITGVGPFEVVPMTTLLSSARHLELDAASMARSDRLSELAGEVGADRLISGSYYIEGDRLHLTARVSDLQRGIVLRAIESVETAQDSGLAGVELLRTRIRAALAPFAHEHSHARASMPPPTYEAYREYLAGFDAFIRRDLESALRHMDRASAHDTSYGMPLIASAIFHMNLGDWEASDSLSRRVESFRDRLGPMELATHDMMKAWLRGDDGAAYDAVVRQAQLAPGTIAQYQIAEQARRLNRPRDALRALRELSPDGSEPQGELRGWRPYWRELAWAHHMLGDHRAELRAARRARQLYPDDPEILLLEAQALAAMGRVTEIERLIQQRLAGPPEVFPSPGVVMLTVGHELRAHGREAAAAPLLERAAAWYDARPEAQRRAYRYARAAALYATGRLEESDALFREILDDAPTHIDARGHIGVIAARRGAREEAAAAAAWLRDDERPFLFGETAYWRARIAAQGGEPAEALRLLGEAFAQGRKHSLQLHTEPDFETLRGVAEFRELIRPRR